MTRFIQLILCILMGSSYAIAQDSFRPFVTNRFDYYLNADYFTSSSNFDSSGGTQNLLPRASLQNVTTSTGVRYLFWDRLGLYTGLIFNNVETNNGFLARTNSLLSYYSVGADFQLYRSNSWSVYFDGNYRLANESVDINRDSAIASDGANEAIMSVVGVFENKDWRFFSRLGIDYRMEGLSMLMKYGFGGDFAFGDLKLGLNFEGLSSIQDDEKTGTPIDRDLVTTRVNAGSRRYFSVNPNSLEAQIYGTYYLDKDFYLKVYGGSTVIGSNSAQGMSAGLALNWGFGVSRKQVLPDQVPNKSSFSNDEPGFKVDTNDGINQDLFKSAKPAPSKK